MECVESKFSLLLEEGQRCPCISPNVNPEIAPKWFNQDKFERAQKLCSKHFASLLFAQLIGLLTFMQQDETFKAAVVAGNHSNIGKLFRRFMSTTLHLKTWYENNPFDKRSAAYISFKRVRGIHKRLTDSMNSKCGRLEGKDRVWISQASLVDNQFTFVGFLALHPREIGIHSLPEEELDCLLYFWRVIGYCVGIEDRFNLCSGTPNEVLQLCRLLYWRKYYPVISDDKVTQAQKLAKGTCLALNKVSPSIYWNVTMKYWFPILKVNKTIELQSFAEYFWYYLICFSMTYATKVRFFRYLMNAWTRICLWLAMKFMDSKYESLRKQYKP